MVFNFLVIIMSHYAHDNPFMLLGLSCWPFTPVYAHQSVCKIFKQIVFCYAWQNKTIKFQVFVIISLLRLFWIWTTISIFTFRKAKFIFPNIGKLAFPRSFCVYGAIFLSQPIRVPLRIVLQESEYQKKRNSKQNTKKNHLCPICGQISRSLKVFKVKEIYRYIYIYMDR